MKTSTVTVSLMELWAAGLDIRQHEDDPRPDEWFVNGTIGPYKSKEAALLAGIKWIYGLYQEYKADFDNSK